jgi:uracil-DNA glycosylase family 4
MTTHDTWERLHDDIVDCRQCPRLVAWSQQVATVKKREFRDWEYWGKPIPPFGSPTARLLIVGLAPAAHGGTRTGRVFTGDSSADFLFATLYRAGFANQPTSMHRGDGLEVIDASITAVGRCAPPANKPTPEELRTCRPFLLRELELLTELKVVICLGKIAFDNYLAALKASGQTVPRLQFGHAIAHDLGPGRPTLISSYHPSRQNTNTGKLTAPMFDRVFTMAREVLEG